MAGGYDKLARACDGKACLRVVGTGREDQRGSTPTLLVTGLWVERQPDEIAGVRDVAAGYHTSSPSGPPQSLSPWRFLGVIRRTTVGQQLTY